MYRGKIPSPKGPITPVGSPNFSPETPITPEGSPNFSPETPITPEGSPPEVLLPRNLRSKIDENLLAELARKQDSRLISTEEYVDEIVKISFICACHGSVISTFEDIESQNYTEYGILTTSIPSHGKYSKISSESGTHRRGIPFHTTTVEYKIDDEPILEFEYQDINTKHLNVTLTTSKTCVGSVVYRAEDSVRVKQKCVNDIMEEIDETCPTNDLFTSFGDYGDTTSITHKKYKSHQRDLKKIEQTRRRDAARRIQRRYKKTQKLMFPLKLYDSEIDHHKKSIKSNMNGKTRLMKYEKERVGIMLNKIYVTKEDDVYTDTHVTTTCDAHKLIMIVTRNTVNGCKSQKYTLLSTLEGTIKTKRKLSVDFSPFIGELYFNMCIKMPTPCATLIDILGLGKSIIEEINGEGASRIVPINIYDLSCNSFNPLPSKYADMYSKNSKLTEREQSIVRIIDDYIRSKDVAVGGSKKMERG